MFSIKKQQENKYGVLQNKQLEGFIVEIILLTDKSKIIEVDGINIKSVNRWKYHYFKNSDVNHFITGSICVWLLMFYRMKGRKY